MSLNTWPFIQDHWSLTFLNKITLFLSHLVQFYENLTKERIIKIESSCAYFLHCQCPSHHSSVFIPKNNSEGPICKWFSTWWFLEMASKLLSSKEVIYKMNHRNTMFKVIGQIAQQFSSNHKSKAYQRLIYFVVFIFEVDGWIRKIWYVYTMVHFKKQKWRSKWSHMQENSRSGN